MDTVTLHTLSIFLSSPGDVNRERQLARDLIEQIQSERFYRNQLKIEVVAWDKPGAGTAMSAHLEPQEAINRGIKKPSQCDIVIVVFWARMGTPLSEKYLKPGGNRYRSGTEYEFLDALNAARKADNPDVLVYRRTNPPPSFFNDPEHDKKKKQWDLVEEFFAEFRNPDGSYRSYYREYEEPSDFKDLLGSDLRDLITQYPWAIPPDKAEFPVTSEESSWEKPPFPGLRAFTPEEKLIFFGRDRESDELITKLSEPSCRFVAVVGASGTGKSSLVAAGLLPALGNDAIPGSKEWIQLRFTPGEVGDNPFMALASAFKPIIERHGQQPRDMAKRLDTYPEELNEFLTMALEGKPEYAELLIFIDQFEELFTTVAEKYRDPFIDLLFQAQHTARVRTVITMRADFYHRCLDHAVLGPIVAGANYSLPTPRSGALHDMITKPAQQAGLVFEDGLVQRILDGTGSQPGAMALMAFALELLWKEAEKSGSDLTHAIYDGFGGVQGAIGKKAEDTFGGLTEIESNREEILARVFRELVEVDEKGVYTRRRAKKEKICDNAASETLVNALINARLLITSRSEDNEPLVEVAHEAIFSNWPRLKEWIDAAADELFQRRLLRNAAAEWDRDNRDKEHLWSDKRVIKMAGVLGNLKIKSSRLNDVERKFLGPIDRKAMLALIDTPETSHQLRATIGRRLSLLGDPRPGTGLRDGDLPDIVWYKVPDGEVTLEIEGMGKTFQVDPFHIAKYPVTWIQYRAFLEAEDGFKNPEWWKKLLFQVNEPGRELNAFDNHPVTDVCWLEAVAFCRWLSGKLGYEIKLPTEYQWQQAATSGDAERTYPWGPDWDPERANTYESGLGRTTAVGMYSGGVSQVGALDMSGNVWEWCLNEFDDPSATGEGGDSARVIRGGSWDLDPGSAAAACRLGSGPDGRGGSVGFRLSCASPIL